VLFFLVFFFIRDLNHSTRVVSGPTGFGITLSPDLDGFYIFVCWYLLLFLFKKNVMPYRKPAADHHEREKVNKYSGIQSMNKFGEISFFLSFDSRIPP
jgi:hypothetical protein